MQKVLITGASGFIGKAVTALAAQKGDWDVYALSSGRKKSSSPDVCLQRVHNITCNLSQLDQIDILIEQLAPDIIIHFAWSIEGCDFHDSTENLRWLEISLHLLRVFKQHGGRRFLFAGSCLEYGYEYQVCSEHEEARPSHLYGTCKLSFTHLARDFCKYNNIEFVTCRYFAVFGPGQINLIHALPTAIDAMMHNQEFVCKGPNNFQDYIYIEDAAEATIRIVCSDYCGIVNIGSGHPISMRDVFTLLAARLETADILSFENETDPGYKVVADTSILNGKLGFLPQISFEQGLSQTVQWWKNEQKEGRL